MIRQHITNPSQLNNQRSLIQQSTYLSSTTSASITSPLSGAPDGRARRTLRTSTSRTLTLSARRTGGTGGLVERLRCLVLRLRQLLHRARHRRGLAAGNRALERFDRRFHCRLVRRRQLVAHVLASSSRRRRPPGPHDSASRFPRDASCLLPRATRRPSSSARPRPCSGRSTQ